ncbi:MAG: hormogonium polysaccharide biosynthesis protein HpsA [Coleofasciculus sp. B1-GNL1-01]|uniref:hormogonium polysaccharide biosynthesis protein HpsA n=1 Tax=Coleofasciculus sp. B1-GNL1-01 TaxID=3068484 RepID=UPI0032F70B95
MSRRKTPFKVIQSICHNAFKLAQTLRRRVMQWILRAWVTGSRRPSNLAKSGFILPTVTMVMLVVILLTTAIMLRSFDRTKNASNYRVNEVVLNAATPALDRAKAKIARLFSEEETDLQGTTPPDTNIHAVLSESRYTFGDETQLRLVADFTGTDNTETSGDNTIQDSERLDTAWKFPVDTDNNGKFDSYTLYGIYFRVPPVDSAGKTERARGATEARALPMDTGTLQGCSALPSAGGWFETGGKLKKAFFVYVATVPIKQDDLVDLGLDNDTKYEAYTGNQGFSALEMQQDQARLSLDNNAVWFNDDVEVTNTEVFRVNGRIHTNANLLVRGVEFSDPEAGVRFYQVSSRASCFYDPENAKMIVAGNVTNGGIRQTSTSLSGNDIPVDIDLFQGTQLGNTTGDEIKETDISGTVGVLESKGTVNEAGSKVASNNAAFDNRIDLMVQAALALHPDPDEDADPSSVAGVSRYGDEISEEFNDKYDAAARDPDLLEKVLTTYFKRRTRRVSYAEVNYEPPDDGLGSYTVANVLGSTNPIRPPDAWMQIDSSNTKLDFITSGSTMELKKTNPALINSDGFEELLGDRILVGNNLPYRWLKSDGTLAEPKEEQPIIGVNWNKPDGTADTEQRERVSRIEELADLGDTTRNGFWEKAAAKTTQQFGDEDLAGGLRVITGAGIYIDGTAAAGGTGTGQRLGAGVVAEPGGIGSFLPSPPPVTGVDTFTYSGTTYDPNDATQNLVVWPDTMPMSGWNDVNGNGVIDANEQAKGDLQMRTTVVYHYADSSGNDQLPLACIATYYDPTNQTTAVNTGSDPRFSLNGVSFPANSTADRSTLITNRLARQASMVFPNGRFVNEPLRTALEHDASGEPLTLADNAAIDAAVCALDIVDDIAADGAIGTSTTSVFDDDDADGIPAIREKSFLDARQVKALHKLNSGSTVLADINAPTQLQIAQTPANLTTQYDLAIEERQPLEIRVTEINLDEIRTDTIGSDKLLPYTGIIYASRDDALLDQSDPSGGSSATDFKLDPTRRPNGIRLINGSTVARSSTNEFVTDEKGLILVSDLPVYIKGDFNLHEAPGGGTELEEFKSGDTLDADYGNFYTRGLTATDNYNRNDQFARRESGGGDMWRATRIFADAVTLLSGDFNDGYRSDGDYDLNNNIGNQAVAARLQNGFWWNDYATSRDYWSGTNNSFPDDSNDSNQSSYFLNGVTPIQRRVNFPEYLMEYCRKLPVSECGPGDWFIGYDVNGNGNLDDSEADLNTELGSDIDLDADGTNNEADVFERDVNSYQLAQYLGLGALNASKLGAGTTAQPALVPSERRYPRRVAFARDASNNLIEEGTPGSQDYQPLGVGCPGGSPLKTFANRCTGSSVPTKTDNALWFATIKDSSVVGNANAGNMRFNDNGLLWYEPPTTNQGQPLLVPILQLHTTNRTATLPNNETRLKDAPNNNWFQQATTTTFNAVLVMGDSPSRPGQSDPPNAAGLIAETGGGLSNFPRFLENWDGETAEIRGSFIQDKKSVFATAPFTAISDSGIDTSLFFDTAYYRDDNDDGFRYQVGASRRRAPYYDAPTRAWGYDVGLLSQTPDLFSKRFATPFAGSPDEFYREVRRNDPWIQTLLCGATLDNGDFEEHAVPSAAQGCPADNKYNS